MKKLKGFSIAVLGAMAMLSSSCTDEIETSALILDDFQSASVKMYVYAPLDIRTEKLQFAPAGTQFLVSTPNSGFNSSASGLFTDTLIVGDNGVIQTRLKVNSSTTTYTVQPIDFEAGQTQVDGAEEAVVNKKYTAATFTITLTAGESYLREVSYAASDYGNANGQHMEMIEIDLYVNGYFNVETDPYRGTIPEGDDAVMIKTRSTSNDWAVEFKNYETAKFAENEDLTNPDYESRYSVVYKFVVPVNQEIEIAPFKRNHTLATGEMEIHEYYKSSIGRFSASDDGRGFKVHLSNNKYTIEVIP